MSDMSHRLPTLSFLVLLSLLLWSCNDPTSIGSELLEEDTAQLKSTDTVRVEARTVRVDSIRTTVPFSALNGYIWGDFLDPIFGRSTARIFAEAKPEFINPNFDNVEVDSVVLVLPYDSTLFYGKTNQEYSVEVTRLLDILPNDRDLYSDVTFTKDLGPLGSATFRPSLDSVEVLNYTGLNTEVLTFPQLRVPLNIEFGRQLVRLDTSVFQSDSLFTEFFKGLAIEPTATTEGLIGFDLFNQRSGIFIYYTRDTIQDQFQLEFNNAAVKHLNFEHDYGGSEVEQGLGKLDSTAYVQGMSGLDLEITFPDLDQLQDVVVNKAELKLFLRPESRGDTIPLDAADQLIISYRGSSGNQILIDDVFFTQADLQDQFGGFVEDDMDDEPPVYRMNLAAHFQDIIDGVVPNTITVSILRKQESPKRTVLFGTGAAQFSPRLELTFTDLSQTP